MHKSPSSGAPRSLEEAWPLRDSDPVAAFAFLDRAEVTALDPQSKARLAIFRAFLLYRRGDLQDALSLILDAIAGLDDTPLTVWNGRASNTAALIYSGLGLPEPAVEFLLTGQRQSQSVGDHGTAFSCFHNMGVELGQMGDYEAALENYQRAEAYADAGLNGHAFLALNRCDLYLDMGDVEAAIETINKGKQHWVDSTNQARVFGLLVEARVALAAGDLDEADVALRTLRNEFDVARAGVELPMLEARLFIQRGDLDAAEAILRAHDIGDTDAKVEDIYLSARLVRIHAEIAETRGDYQRALAIERSARDNEYQRSRQALARVTALIMDEHNRQLALKAQELEEQTAVVADLRELHAQVNELSLRDHLTGLYNRRYLAEHLDTVVKHHQRYDRDVSLLVFDVDDFKAINDTYLHATGDEVLQIIASLLQSQKRASDVLCRLGGDEFVALLPETNLCQAHNTANRLHAAVRDYPWSATVAEGLSVSVSIGATTAAAGDTLDDLLQAADRAMYGAKSAGKNQVFSTSDEPLMT